MWGFPSTDSDYDVRFIYARPVKDYLTVKPIRDVIETPIVNDPVLGVPMDMCGWDIKKAIDLSQKTNRALVEWMQSDIVYIKTSETGKLWEYINSHIALESLANHYIGWTRSMWKEIKDNTQRDGKKYCYALRTALCAEHIIRLNKIPSPNIKRLIEAHPNADDLAAAFNDVLKIKIASKEHVPLPKIVIFEEIISSVLEQEYNLQKDTAIDINTSNEDALFREIIGFL